MPTSTPIPIETLIEALLDESKPLAPRFLHRLTDLNLADQAQLATAWPRISTWRRKALLEDLEGLTSADSVLSFEAVGQVALQDSEAVVRKLAVDVLNEYEIPDLIPQYLQMLQNDPDAEVRAAIAMSLGAYVYLGELEELSPGKVKKVVDCLLAVAEGADAPTVRQRALESLAFSSREEITPLIERAYKSGKRDWLPSVLLAMGRSANEIWREPVLRMLNNDVAAVRAEATSAAGELGLKEAVPQLVKMIDDDDDRVRTAAVWSLSQIGGENVRKLLEDLLDQVEDEDEVEFVEEALENLSLTEDDQFLLFDVDDFNRDDEE